MGINQWLEKPKIITQVRGPLNDPQVWQKFLTSSVCDGSYPYQNHQEEKSRRKLRLHCWLKAFFNHLLVALLLNLYICTAHIKEIRTVYPFPPPCAVLKFPLGLPSVWMMLTIRQNATSLLLFLEWGRHFRRGITQNKSGENFTLRIWSMTGYVGDKLIVTKKKFKYIIFFYT